MLVTMENEPTWRLEVLLKHRLVLRVAQACNPSTLDVEAGRSVVQS